MPPDADYNINLDVKFPPLAMIDVGQLAEDCEETWFNQTLCRVNDSVVRLGVLHGEFHWHQHSKEDEYFYVVEGELLIDLEGRTVSLGPKQSFVVPRGILHRTRCPERTVVLMVETSEIQPTGDGAE